MEHNHHGHHHHHSDGEKNIKIAFFLNFAFTLLEIVGGIWTNSMAILSDALHDLGDSLSLGIAWYLEKKSGKKPDGKFTFGYSRFSLLGAVINSMVLVGGSALVLVNAIPRIFAPEDVKAEGMLIFAIFGIIVNTAAMLKLKKGSSLNQRTVSWHLLEDALGWAVVLVASIILMFYDIPIIDPILSVAITVYVLYNAVKNLKKAVDIFLQAAPPQFSVEGIEKELMEMLSVKKVYHTHIWSMDGQRNIISTNIVVNDEITRQNIIDIKISVREYLKKKGIIHPTIEIEFECENRDNLDF